jgi:ribosomal protein L11 methyltransferase
MKYFEAEFVISPLSADATDLLAAIAGEAGFESFEETPTGLKGYVQQQLFDQSALQTALTDFPFDQVDITYSIREAEDRDWNEQWEQEGFEPITVNNTIVIHDGRHLPTEEISHLSPLIEIEIDAHLAFGTGTHETTRMICSTLLSHLSPLTSHPSPLRVLDCGTGTGILSICALKLGATEAVGYDIDEWSADNARHNAVINHVDDRFISLLGDASILNKVEGTFDLVLANINRNILLADMPAFRQKMAPGATLILSGFYTADSPMLIDKAATIGLTLQQQKEDHDWACLVFS